MSFALSPFRVVTGLVFASVLSLFTAAGCSQQAEGERCDKAKNGDADCDSGLICVPAAGLIDHNADRCCHPSTTDQGDQRCTRDTETTNNPPVSNPEGGAGGAAGSDSGGAPDQGGTAGAMSQGGNGGMSGGGTGGGAGAPGDAGSAGAATAGAGGAP